MNEQVLTVIMKEYEMLRAESQDKQKTQFTMISLIVSAISIVFGLTADLESSAVKISLPILYCFLLPCTIMFFGILWLDQVYRQVMIGAYTVQIEDRINSLLRAGMPSGMSNIIGWEQWLSAMRPTKGFWRRTNYYYAYISLGTFSVLPIVVFAIGCVLTRTPLWPIYLVVLLVVFAVYLLFVVLLSNNLDYLCKALKNRHFRGYGQPNLLPIYYFWGKSLDMRSTARASRPDGAAHR